MLKPLNSRSESRSFCNTAFGDYPHYLPSEKTNNANSQFTGWMLLNYNKPVEVSSTLGAYAANNAVDEVMKTYWSANTGDKGEYLISDLGSISEVRAIQINYADQDVDSSFLGKINNISHKYVIYASNDKRNWTVVMDKSKNTQDVPHDYIELEKPINTRFLKIVNEAMPSGKFALSGFRVFGNGGGQAPKVVNQFMVLRTLNSN